MITQTLVLHLVPDGVRPKIYLNQYDTGLQKLKFVLVDVDDYYEIPSGTTILFIGSKSDKKFFSYAATYSGHEVTVDVTDQMTAVPGFVDTELRMMNGSGGVLGSINLDIVIERSPFKDLMCSQNDLRSVDETVIDATASAARAKEEADRAKTEGEAAVAKANAASDAAIAASNTAKSDAQSAASSAISQINSTASSATTAAQNASSNSIAASQAAAKAAEDARDAAIEKMDEVIEKIAELAENGVILEWIAESESLKFSTADGN